MAKMGRPKAEDPRNRSIGLRLREADYQRLLKYAEAHDMTITEVVEKSILFLEEQEEENSENH